MNNRREQMPDHDPTIPNQFYGPLTSVFAILNSYARQREREHNEMVLVIRELRASMEFIVAIDADEPVNGLKLAQAMARDALNVVSSSGAA